MWFLKEAAQHKAAIIHILPPRTNRFLSADIIKGLPPAVLRRTTPTHFPLCFASPAPPDLYCSLLLSEHLPTNKKRAKSTATVERGGQHTGGQEAFHCRLFRRVVFSGGWFISGQRGEARRLLYETNTASDAA